jgi:hypothetical protein
MRGWERMKLFKRFFGKTDRTIKLEEIYRNLSYMSCSYNDGRGYLVTYVSPDELKKYKYFTIKTTSITPSGDMRIERIMKPTEIDRHCNDMSGVHPTYVSFIRTNDIIQRGASND